MAVPTTTTPVVTGTAIKKDFSWSNWIKIPGIILLVLGAVMLVWSLLPSGSGTSSTPNQTARPAAPVSQPQVAVAPSGRTDSGCSGDLETILLGPNWVDINVGGRCAVPFDTMSGVALLGEPSNYVEDYPGAKLGNVLREKGVRVIKARAKSGTARLNYMKCPHGTVVPGQFACNLALASNTSTQRSSVGVEVGGRIGVYRDNPSPQRSDPFATQKPPPL